MSDNPPPDRRPAALKASITDLENSILRRRTDIRSIFGSLTSEVRERTVSPGGILAAGLLGALLQRNHRLRNLVMVAILPMVGAGIRHLFTTKPASKRMSPAEKMSQEERCEYAAAERNFVAEGAPPRPPTNEGYDTPAHPSGDKSYYH